MILTRHTDNGGDPLVLWTSDVAIMLGDIARWWCLVQGLCIAAVLVRSLFIGSPTREPGFHLRSVVIAVLSTSACLAEWSRLGDEVTVRLPINVLGLTLATWSLWVAAKAKSEETPAMQALREHVLLTPEDRLQRALAEVLGEEELEALREERERELARRGRDT